MVEDGVLRPGKVKSQVKLVAMSSPGATNDSNNTIVVENGSAISR